MRIGDSVVVLLACSCVAQNASPKSTFEQCVTSKPAHSFGTCVGIGALSTLQSLDDDPSFDVVDGVSFNRDEQQQREFSNFLERDPADFRTIVDTVGHVMSRRVFRWGMDAIYPGLAMRVTPSVDGVLEFTVDPHRADIELKHHKPPGTVQLLSRQIVLPFLLGLKFKVATLIPIIFGVLALLAKKAVIVSKLALIISSVLALSSMFFGTKGPAYAPVHGHYGFNPGFGGYKVEDNGDYQDFLYKEHLAGHGLHDELTFRQIPTQQHRNERNLKGRNFAWNDADKEKP